jgi:hypothetical protein
MFDSLIYEDVMANRAAGSFNMYIPAQGTVSYYPQEVCIFYI